MIKYYLPVLLAVTSLSYANSDAMHHPKPCPEGDCIRAKQKNHSNEVLSHFIETDDMSGYACYTYKFNTNQDKTQLLGVLRDPSAPLIESAEPAHKQKTKKRSHKKSKKVSKKSEHRAPAAKHDPQKHADAMNVDPNMKIVEPTVDYAPIPKVENEVLKSHVSAPVSTDLKPVEIETPDTKAVIESTPQASGKEGPAPVVATEPKTVEVAPQANTAPVAAPVEHSVKMSFEDLEVNFSDQDSAKVKTLAIEMLSNPNLMAKITSNCFDKNGNHAEARRVALQRAIKVRKILIDVGVNPNNVSVYATEDLELKANSLEVVLKDETKVN